MNVLTIGLRIEDEDDRAARVLGGLADLGKLPRFMQCIEECRDTWTVLHFLQEDMLAFAAVNPWCGATDGWALVLGHCAELEDLPQYTVPYWGQVQAWLVYQSTWAVTVQPADLRGGPDQDDLLVWDLGDFEEHCAATPITGCVFCEEFGIYLNRAMREYRQLEALL